MSAIRFLGSGGSVQSNAYTTCIQITKNTLIDAGNILQGLGNDAKYIDNIFLTHSHLDHIVDIAFLVDNYYKFRKKPLKIYGLSEVINNVKKYIFNWNIWPDFSEINLIETDTPTLEFVKINENIEYKIEDNITLIPFLSNHTVACCGYIIKKNSNAIFFTADTYKNKKIWDYVNANTNVKALIVDVSFPDKLMRVAKESKHLTPKLLFEDMQYLKRDDLKIYANHLKPLYRPQIVKDLKKLGFSEKNIIDDGDIIFFRDGSSLKIKNSQADKIKKLNSIGIALSSQKDIDILLEMIVTEAKNITNSDGGTLYLKDNNELKFTVVQTDTLGIKMGGKSGKITWPNLKLYLKDGTPNTKMVAVTCALNGKIINIPDVYDTKDYSFDGTKEFDKVTGYRSKSMLVIPLKNYDEKIIGVLQLINKQDYLYDKIIPFSKDDEEILLSLASQAAVAISNVNLIKGLENLLESFLKSIIYTISKKSPYTAAHIKRMVELSNMIVDEIDKNSDIFKDKHFSNEQKRVINFAALMHDIGKLAIPEYILDKSKKLEKLSDGLDIIQLRIELIKKEFKIAQLKGEISKEDMLKNIEELDKYFSIIRDSNIGDESTPKENISLFNMLSQKAYKLNGKVYKVLTKEEAYKLSTQRGTLTKEEKKIVNSHAKISLNILKTLPFPEKYKNIPMIAGSHHEKINGKGYPLGLKGDEISFEARILAIADIFEALTASDRPYKKANNISKAMKILYGMTKDGELDKDLVKYFYNSKLYLKYAQKYLPKKYIDKVDVNFNAL